MDDYNSWTITPEERINHDAQFQFLKPTNGCVTGEQVKPFFLKSGLPPLVLGQIWALIDINGEGRLDKKKFSIAMFLIAKVLQGKNLPQVLPNSLINDSASMGNAITAPVSNALERITSPIDASQWTIPLTSRPKYRLLFNQLDRTKRGLLTGVETKGIFMQSGLSLPTLANIWSLADMDKDGNLNCDEFCVAYFLIEKALAGFTIPYSLPADTFLSQFHQISPSASTLSSIRSFDNPESPGETFEDRRRENFRLGQAELNRRQQELNDQLRLEEEQRLEVERQEREKDEKVRLEKERQKTFEAEQQANLLRALETQREIQRQQASEIRTKNLRDVESIRQLEAEKQRVESLKLQKQQLLVLLEQTIAHKASLIESSLSQEQRRQNLESHLLAVTTDVDTHKRAINEMRDKRDVYERDIRELTEHVEAAKAEITRWQREGEQLNFRVSTNVHANPTFEQRKALLANLESCKSSNQKLRSQLQSMDENVTRYGKELASRRNLANDLNRRYDDLRPTVQELYQTLQQVYKSHQEQQLTNEFSTLKVMTSPNSTSSDPYEVMFDFSARHPDELSLVKGSIVQVPKSPPVSVASGWLYGRIGEKYGLFPDSYVRKYVVGTIDPFDPFGVHKPPATSQRPTIDGPLATDTNDLGHQPIVSSVVLFDCVAIYPFDSDVVGDLTLAADDVVHVHQIRDQWWEGTSERTKMTGMFPANYVRRLPHDSDNRDTVLSAPNVLQSAHQNSSPESGPSPADLMMAPSTPEFVRVVTPFTAASPGQLSLVPGQVIQLRKRSKKGWWEGELQQRGRVRQFGWFPADFVTLIAPTSFNTAPVSSALDPIPSTNSSRPTVGTSARDFGPRPSTDAFSSDCLSNTTATSNSPVVELMRAVFAYKAVHADELTFEEGAIITILGRDEPEWWRGRIESTGAEGLFPVNYVQPCNPNVLSADKPTVKRLDPKA